MRHHTTLLTDCFPLVALVALTRFFTRSHFLYDIDSVNFALAILKFDPAVYQPHPPGYFLYIILGRLLNLVTGDANAAFVLISIVASCGAAVMIYLLAFNWYGRRAATAAALLFACSPLAWFHGTVALTYMVECFFSTTIGYLGWRLRQGHGSGKALAMTLGIATGFRPSTILFLGPLCLYAMCTRGTKQKIHAALVLAATLLTWLVPMLLLAGGPHRYIDSLLALWSVAPAKNAIWASPIAFSVARFLLVLAITGLCFGAGLAFSFLRTAIPRPSDRGISLFIWIWILPGLLFFTLIFLLFVNSGYLLVLSPPLFAVLGRNIFAWCVRWNSAGYVRNIALLAAAAANTAFFFSAPVYCSLRSVRRFEADLVSFTSAVRRTIAPDSTILIGFDSHFLGYRHAAYYLPEYLTVQYPGLRIAGEPGAFAARNRQTLFLHTLPVNHFQTLALLPLPENKEDTLYLDHVYSRFPNHDLSRIRAGRWSFAIASVSDLTHLFGSL
jgi:4-amino-4-deoxy-L-arabinose transferase-like glycosyltransferase